MINFELLVCAETLMKDPERESFSAINIMEDFVAEAFPTFIPKFNVLLITSILEETYDKVINVKFNILNNAIVLHDSNLDIDFKGKDKANTRVAVNGLAVREPGKLIVKFFL